MDKKLRAYVLPQSADVVTFTTARPLKPILGQRDLSGVLRDSQPDLHTFSAPLTQSANRCQEPSFEVGRGGTCTGVLASWRPGVYHWQARTPVARPFLHLQRLAAGAPPWVLP